jgi:hypothetical protein
MVGASGRFDDSSMEEEKKEITCFRFLLVK